MRAVRFALFAAFALVILVPAAVGQAPGAPTSPFKADLVASMDDAAKKLVDLAQAMPAEKYGWRPASGVRSVSEVYMHVAEANFFLPTFLGIKAPEGMADRGLETKVTDKAKVIETLKQSIDHLHDAVSKVPDADLDKKAKVFGHEMTQRSILLLLATHMHEHLGQSIAYARSNGVTPPWSASEGEPGKKTGGK